jgi:beta-galactosidase
MKFKLFLFACLFQFALQVTYSQNLRNVYNFNPGWKLLVKDIKEARNPDYNDSHWKSVTLPHAWNEDEAFRLSIDSLSTGICWYRKHFQMPPKDEGKKVWLEFEGIRQAGEFYLNGTFIGRHENGINAFGFDITALLKPSGIDNVLAVRIDNDWEYKEKSSETGFQWNDKNFNANYGGLSKNVRLHVAGKLYQTLPLLSSLNTTGLYVYAKDFKIEANTATIVASAQIKNESGDKKSFIFEVEVRDADDQLVQTFNSQNEIEPGATMDFSAESVVNKLNFWSWGHGYLYTVITRIKSNHQIIDEVKTRTGFRKTAFKDGMVYLNDQVLMMKGYAQRSSNEWPAIGLSVPPWLSDYSNALMVESNANLVRWMHITPWKQDIESCDRVGLIQAMPAGDAEKDVEGVKWEQRIQVMKDAIVYNRNNPSIIFYESGNEVISKTHMIEMKAIRDRHDPYGGRAIGSREMLNVAEAEYGGEMLYINKSATKPVWSMEYSRDEGLRKYWDEFSPPYHKDGDGPTSYKSVVDNAMKTRPDAKVYNRNQDSHAIENIIRWAEYYDVRPGTGKRVSSGGVNIIFSDSNTHFRGAENYRRSGEVDAMRIPKDGFYAHKVMWDGWVDAKNTGLHLVGHWNYKDGVTKDVFVVSAGEKVELFLNKKSLGFGTMSHRFLFTFKNIKWEAGEIKAVSYDKHGNQLAEKKIITSGKPFAIKLTSIQNPTGFKADGADVVLAQVEVVDQKGNRCPTALNMINFELLGPSEWRGGIAQGRNNYILSKSLPVECGVNRVMIRSTTTSGIINLTAQSDGLKPANIRFISKPIIVKDGLAKLLPADGLSPIFQREATPKKPTYHPHRRSIEIINVSAGANDDQAKASIDDNELSDWTNDGRINTAWIEYTLATKSMVSAVSLKLNGFRTKKYPIRILLDGEEIFAGKTETSLGYFLAKCNPTAGSKVRIELARPVTEKEKQDFGVEINGKKLDDGNGQINLGNGTLSIIETEIYEDLPNSQLH